MAETRCPNPRCGVEFAVPDRQLGRNVTCPTCGQILTARPLAIWQALDRRAADLAAGQVAAAALDEPRGFQAREAFRRQWLYVPVADPSTAAADTHAYDPLYEPTSDRVADPLLPTADLAVVLDDLRSQWNVGSIFRTAEGAGWAALRLCGITPTPPARGLVKTALGAERHLPWQYHTHILEALDACRAEGRTLVALEQTDDARDLSTWQPPPKMALVLGNEVVGVSAEALARCSHRLYIPMAGKKASLNVAVAFGVAAFQLAMRWRQRHAPAASDTMTDEGASHG